MLVLLTMVLSLPSPSILSFYSMLVIDQKLMSNQSERHFLEICQSISMFFHGSEYLLDGVAGQYHKVDEEKGPKDIELQHFEIGADKSHHKGESSPLPHLHLSQSTGQRLVCSVFQLHRRLIGECLLMDVVLKWSSIQSLSLLFHLAFLLADALRSEVADEQLQQVESNQIGNDIEGGALCHLHVRDNEDAGGSPTYFSIEHQSVDEGVVETTNLADGTRCKHQSQKLKQNLSFFIVHSYCIHNLSACTKDKYIEIQHLLFIDIIYFYLPNDHLLTNFPLLHRFLSLLEKILILKVVGQVRASIIELQFIGSIISTMSRKEIQDKELKTILAKDIGAKNPIFSTESIAELHALFSLYADPRQRRADIREFLLTAGTLGLDTKYEFVFRLLQEVQDSTNGNALDFEQFLKELTTRIGNPFSEEGRKANFTLLDVQAKGELDLNDLRYINEQLRYGYSDEQLVEIIHSVGGFGAESISWEKFNKFIQRKVDRRRLAI